MPEQAHELEQHRSFLGQRSIALLPHMPEALIVMRSKLVRVLEVPAMLDTIHHGGYAELWALTQAFDFEILIWNTEPDHNRWIGTGTDDLRLTDADARQRAEGHTQLLQLIYEGSGLSGHFGLVWADRPAMRLFRQTPWLEMWQQQGATVLQEKVGIVTAHPLASDPRISIEDRATALGKVAVPIPGDGWCLLHAVSWYLRGHESPELAWCVSKAAKTYLQALEWLMNQLVGSKAPEVLAACMPEQEHELEQHKTFLRHHRITLLPHMSDALVVLCSKVVRILEMPRMLDTIHHAGHAELRALMEAFDFAILIWQTETDNNRWIGAGMDDLLLSDTDAQRRAEGKVLKVIYDGSGITGHYGLVQAERPPVTSFYRTPWLDTWQQHGATALHAQLGIVTAPQIADQSTANTDPWPAPASSADSMSEVAAADTESVLPWNSQASSDGSSADPILQTDADRTWTTLEDEQLKAIQELSQHFRKQPLLPPPLPHCAEEISDTMLGAPYPATHCAFATIVRGAATLTPVMTLCSQRTLGVYRMYSGTAAPVLVAAKANNVCGHISQHSVEFQHCPGDIPSAYIAALNHAEEQTVPAVGWSVDRRTLRRLHRCRHEDNCVALICSCCASVLPSGPRSDIGYLSVQRLFEGLTPDSFKQNWDLAQYKLYLTERIRPFDPGWKDRSDNASYQQHFAMGNLLCAARKTKGVDNVHQRVPNFVRSANYQSVAHAGLACGSHTFRVCRRRWPTTIGTDTHWSCCIHTECAGSKRLPHVHFGHHSFASTWKQIEDTSWRKSSIERTTALLSAAMSVL